MIYPGLEEVKRILKEGNYKRIPIKTDLNADMLTPLTVVRKLKNVSRHVFLLESAEQSKQWGRYTFLGYDPVLSFTCTDGTVSIKSGTEQSFECEDPDTQIRKIIRENRAPVVNGMPPFVGGLVGYFSYDYIKYSEPSLKESEPADKENFPDADLMLFDRLIVFDNYRQKIDLIVNIKTEDIETSYHKGELELESMKQLLLHGELAVNRPLKLKSPFRYLFSREEYCNMVEKGKYYIREGDIFQIVLSNRIDADIEGSLLDTYRILRMENPSPYMFYFTGTDMEIAGASPETLVKLENGVLHTFPLAGTRPRGKSETEDAALEKDLLSDEKELAEHNMLVDLGRNDIGKISRFRSIEVEKYMHIEKFSHVMHIGSTIRGVIRDGLDALDAVDSILPAGTLSGAPKLKACELIGRLENNRRGIYGGAVGYIDLSGNLDTCIAIRLAYARNGKVFVRSGAGIVADSVPESEYTECANKAKAVVEALKEAEGGIDR